MQGPVPVAPSAERVFDMRCGQAVKLLYALVLIDERLMQVSEVAVPGCRPSRFARLQNRLSAIAVRGWDLVELSYDLEIRLRPSGRVIPFPVATDGIWLAPWPASFAS